jgi:mannitol 2-dehydrogenase
VPGIAHIGVGAFSRAHLGVYQDRCLADDDQRGWGIVGVNLRAADGALAQSLRAQDNLYSVTSIGADGERDVRVVGAMVEHHHAPAGALALVHRLADPAIRIVTLTITEGGYPAGTDGAVRRDDPDIAHDLGRPQDPRTAFGLIVAALAQRRARRIAPFAVLSCDNLRHNGAHARRSALAFAHAHPDGLAQWIESTVDFPNAMVDRITPAMSEQRRVELAAASGIDDQAPVVCEPWLQWVIEDRFRGGRPAWERHGVQLVPDVTPYEDAKLRLLNGAHQMLSFPALLAGFEQVHDAVADPELGDYLRRFMSEDAIPGLASTPGLDLAGYAATLMRRFANAAIADRVERLCQDAGGKLPVYIRPTLTSSLRSGRDGRRLAFMLACFDRYLRVRRDDRGNELVVRDANAMHLLRPVMASDSPLTLLHQVDLVGPEAAGDRAFVAQYLSVVDALERRGTLRTLGWLDARTA